jgi:hypothetical protein
MYTYRDGIHEFATSPFSTMWLSTVRNIPWCFLATKPANRQSTEHRAGNAPFSSVFRPFPDGFSSVYRPFFTVFAVF